MKKKHVIDRRAFRESPNGAEALALDVRLFGNMQRPGAFGLFFDVPPPIGFDPESIDEGVAVVNICGPLEHHSSWLWHSYEDIVAESRAAMEHELTRALVLRIDSPGGVCCGMGEAYRALRKLSEDTGKPIYAFADELAASAAYHIASAASEIWTPRAGQLGSIGVILCTVDETAMLNELGIKVRYLVTGARKADMHPGQPVDNEVLKVAQAKVDFLGRLFFEAVGESRGVAPAAVEALDAAVFYGEEATRKGLADGVAGWAEFLSIVKSAIRDTGEPERARARRPETAQAGNEATAMKLLQLQKALTKATADVDEALKAYSKNPTSKTRKALESAFEAKSKAAAAVEEAKMTTTRHVKHEEKVVEREEDEDEEAEESETAAEDEEPEDEEDDEEESSALAKAWSKAEKAFRAEMKGTGLEAFGPERLRRLTSEITGASGVRGIFGGLEGLGARLKKVAATEGRIEKLEKESRSTKVERLIEKAQKEGRCVGKVQTDFARSQGMTHGAEWLESYFAAQPKDVRTLEDGALKERSDAAGNAIGAPTTSEQEAIMEQMMAGLPADQRAAFKDEYEKNAKARASGTLPSH